MTKILFFFFFQAEDGIRDIGVTGVQTCALPISLGQMFVMSGPWKDAGRDVRSADRRVSRLPGRTASMTLKDKTLFISGGSRGVGLAIATRAARDGANVALIAKTAEPHPELEGTGYTAAAQI